MALVTQLRKNLKGKGKRKRVVSGANSATGVAVYKWAKERKR